MTTPKFTPAAGLLGGLDLLHIELAGALAHVQLNRPAKRNAISDAMLRQLHTAIVNLPDGVRAIILSGAGRHFCAGLDLASLNESSVADGIAHSRMWQAATDALQFARAPIVCVLHGAVVGGGLEIASAAHIRIAESSTYYALPEGQHGIFVGGGGSARVPRLAGVACMTDMMLCGRVLDAREGHARGLSQYLVEDGEGFAKALALARRIAANAPLSNFAITQALPRIAGLSQADGLFVESLMAAIAQAEPAAKDRMRAFLEGKARKVRKT